MNVSRSQKFFGIITIIFGLFLTILFLIPFLSLLFASIPGVVFPKLLPGDLLLTVIPFTLGTLMIVKGIAIVRSIKIDINILISTFIFYILLTSVTFVVESSIFWIFYYMSFLNCLLMIPLSSDIFILVNNYKHRNNPSVLKRENSKSIYYFVVAIGLLLIVIITQLNIPIGGRFYKGLSGVYYEDGCVFSACTGPLVKIEDQIDYWSFEPIENPQRMTHLAYDDNYTKDKNNVYFLKYGDMGDIHYTFYSLEYANPETFRIIGYYTATDINEPTLTKAPDITKLKPHIYWGVDDKHVWQSGRLIDGLDGKTFQVLDECYVRDSNKIFAYDHNTYATTELTRVDIESFEIEDVCQAKDKNHRYDGGEIIN